MSSNSIPPSSSASATGTHSTLEDTATPSLINTRCVGQSAMSLTQPTIPTASSGSTTQQQSASPSTPDPSVMAQLEAIKTMMLQQADSSKTLIDKLTLKQEKADRRQEKTDRRLEKIMQQLEENTRTISELKLALRMLTQKTTSTSMEYTKSTPRGSTVTKSAITHPASGTDHHSTAASKPHKHKHTHSSQISSHLSNIVHTPFKPSHNSTLTQSATARQSSVHTEEGEVPDTPKATRISKHAKAAHLLQESKKEIKETERALLHSPALQRIIVAEVKKRMAQSSMNSFITKAQPHNKKLRTDSYKSGTDTGTDTDTASCTTNATAATGQDDDDYMQDQDVLPSNLNSHFDEQFDGQSDNGSC